MLEIFGEKSTGEFVTPYKNFTIIIGKTYKSKLIKEYNVINVGLHSFVNFRDMKKSLNYNYDRFTVKCIIPKGSKYYLGDYDGTNDSYASDKLKYICKVDENGNDIITKKTFVEKLKTILKIK